MTETVTMEAIADAGEIGISPALAAVLDPDAASGAQKDGIRCSEHRRRSSASAPRSSAASRGLDIASAHPRRGPRPRPAAEERARAPNDHGRLHRPDGHGRLLEELGPEALAASPRRAHARDPGGGAAIRGALLRDRRRQVQRQGAADRRRAVEHRPRRGADAPGPARDHGAGRHRADAHRGQHRQGLHGRLRPALSPRVPRLRRRDQHRGPGHEQGRAGQILSTEIVLERSRTIFETTPIAPFAAKGKAEPVKASIVGPAVGVKDSHHGGRGAAGPGGGVRDHPRRHREGARPARAGSSRSRAAPAPARPASSRKRSREPRTCDRSVHAARSTRRRRRTSRSGPSSATSSALDAGADADEVGVALREAVERLRCAPRAVDPTPRDPARASTCRTRRRPRRSTSGSSATRLSDVALRFLFGQPLGRADDVRHRGRAVPRRGERAICCSACRAPPRTCRQVLHHHARRGRRGLPADDDGVLRVTFELGPLTAEAMTAILETATEDDPLRRTRSRSSRADPAAMRCSSSSCSIWSGRPARSKRCRTPSSRSSRARSIGSRRPTGRCFATPPCSARRSTRDCSRTACARTSSSTPRSGSGSASSSTPSRTASCGSGTPSSATRPTKGCRSAPTRAARARRPRRSRRRRASRSTRRSASSRSTSTRPNAGTRHGTTAGSPATEPCRSTPTSRRLGSSTTP